MSTVQENKKPDENNKPVQNKNRYYRKRNNRPYQSKDRNRLYKNRDNEQKYNIKTTLYHKVADYAFEGEELQKLNRAVMFTDSAFPYHVYLTEVEKEYIMLGIENVAESEKETAVKEVAVKISQFMHVESQAVQRGLRQGRIFMFKGPDACPVEITAI